MPTCLLTPSPPQSLPSTPKSPQHRADRPLPAEDGGEAPSGQAPEGPQPLPQQRRRLPQPPESPAGHTSPRADASGCPRGPAAERPEEPCGEAQPSQAAALRRAPSRGAAISRAPRCPPTTWPPPSLSHRPARAPRSAAAMSRPPQEEAEQSQGTALGVPTLKAALTGPGGAAAPLRLTPRSKMAAALLLRDSARPPLLIGRAARHSRPALWRRPAPFPFPRTCALPASRR